MYQKGAGFYFRAGREVKAIREPSRQGREEKGAVIYLDQFPEALEIQTGSENHWRDLRFANKEVILDDLPFLPCRAASLRHSKYYLCLPFL